MKDLAIALSTLLVLVHAWHRFSRGKVMAGDDATINRAKAAMAIFAGALWALVILG